MLRYLYFTFSLLFCPYLLFATHNRAGEITYEQIDELTIRATITTYTKTSAEADRPMLLIDWGDGTFDTLMRDNGDGTQLPNDVKINYYFGQHTYTGRGTYTLSMTDPNRNGGILNVNPPNSVNVPFYIETTVTLLNPIFNGRNSSAVLLQPPLDYGCVGQPFIHNPNAYDPDGDSLAYEWAIPKQAVGTVVPRYTFPDQIEPGANNQITLDPETGTIIWDSPRRQGEYNIAFVIKEYRNGRLLNVITRDMQIIINADCDNRPPTLDFLDRFCITAPELLEVPVAIDDPDMPQQQVRTTVSGGPFELTLSPAQFDGPLEYTTPPIDALFSWDILCDHIRVEPYQVVIRAEDNFDNGESGLTTLQTLRIQVVGPSPNNLLVNEMADGNELRWDRPYACEETPSGLFRGFVVWRKEDGDGVVQGECYTDLAAQGYVPIAFEILTSNDIQYVYTDTDIDPLQIYCYRVTALFAQETDGGQLFNRAHSRPSNVACTNIRRDIPFLTKASVTSTDPENGEVEVSWIPPFREDFDENIFIPPYRFDLRRGNEVIFSQSYDQFDDFPATFEFRDASLNTLTESHTYTVDLYSNGDLVGASQSATSMFLSLQNIDEGIELSWSDEVPWINNQYVIFRQNQMGDFDSIGTTSGNTRFVDNLVKLDSSYCYLVRSSGQYFFIPVMDIVNFSQEACLTREFNFPPCPPFVSVEADCSTANDEIQDSFRIALEWDLPSDCLLQDSQIAGYNVYFRSNADSANQFRRLNNTLVLGNQYVFSSLNGVTGCFIVRSVNLEGLESVNSETECFEGSSDCVSLSFPNAFTPNGDGQNDVFKPISFRFVNEFQLSIFNRWGNKVFETNDINFNWDGTDFNGSMLNPGVYFYECSYGYDSESLSVPLQEITGFIELLR